MTIISIDSSVLLNFYAARSGGTAGGAATAATAAPTAPTAPWSQANETQTVSALTQSVLNGARFIDPTAAKLDAPPTAASASDYRNLFALYQGLSALNGIAQQASATGVGETQAAALQQRFQAGLQEVQSFVAGRPFSALQFADGASGASETSTVGTAREADSYAGAVVESGDAAQAVPGLAPDAKFSVTAKKLGGASTTVNFDLSEMGGQTRTLANVTTYLNGKMAAAGLATRFSVQRTPGVANTVVAGGQTVALGGSSPDQFSLAIAGSSLESLSFSAPAATPAVYLAQTSGASTGATPDAVQQLIKLDPTAPAGGDRVFADTLPAGLGTVRATATGPDGSVYLLADVTGPTPDGQVLDGASDTALVRYDSAGQLSYVRTLGAQAASGLSLAVSPDGGQVAVAGVATGDLDPGDASAPGASAGFVQVFDAAGDAQWSTRLADGTRPQDVAFADGSLLVQGATHTDLDAPGVRGVFLQSLSATRRTAFDGSDLGYTVTRASAADPGPVGAESPAGVLALPNGGVVTAAVENGHAVLRLYAGPLGAGAQPTAVRDLGDLGGGSLAGLSLAADGSIVVAGASGSGGLSAGAVTTAYAGGSQAFVAKLGADLQPGASDRLSYLSTGGNAVASAVAVSGGQVYVAGQVAQPAAASGASSEAAFVAAVDPQTGEVGWSDRVQGLDGQAAPTGLAVDASGASALDALGLPRGAIDYTPSDLVVANTSARAGDSFTLRSGTGAPVKVTLEAGDTLATLATKIGRATGFAAAATVTTVNGRDQLNIAPAAGAGAVTLQAGPAGADLLKALGLPEGVVQAASPASASAKTSVASLPYALRLDTSLDVSTVAGAKNAMAALAGALTTVQQAYSDLTTKPASASASATADAGVSAYTQARISNYQLALSRLTGSG